MHNDLTRVSLVIGATAGTSITLQSSLRSRPFTREMRSFAVTWLSGWFQAHLLST